MPVFCDHNSHLSRPIPLSSPSSDLNRYGGEVASVTTVMRCGGVNAAVATAGISERAIAATIISVGDPAATLPMGRPRLTGFHPPKVMCECRPAIAACLPDFALRRRAPDYTPDT